MKTLEIKYRSLKYLLKIYRLKYKLYYYIFMIFKIRKNVPFCKEVGWLQDRIINILEKEIEELKNKGKTND